MSLDAEKFWAQVGKSAPSGCWLWTGTKNGTGYGWVYTGYKMNGAKVRSFMKLAHRIAYMLTHGEIPEGKHICHHCDNPPCVNPAHLYAGTQKENTTDAWRRGRRTMNKIDNAGEKHGMARLDEKTVLEIRASSGPQRAIASHFGISQGAVYLIKARKRWAHI
jgi:hypothetical protein